MLLARRISRGNFFLAVFFRVAHSGLSERGTTRSLSEATQWRGKKKSLHSFWSAEEIPNAPYPPLLTPLPPLISFCSSSWYQFIFVNFSFQNLILHIFLIIIIIIRYSGMFRNVPECSGMFWDVPGCSGMFHVPGFINGLSVRDPWKILRVSRNSIIETRFSNLENFEDRELSFESRRSTYLWAVLYMYLAQGFYHLQYSWQEAQFWNDLHMHNMYTAVHVSEFIDKSECMPCYQNS